VRSYFRVIGTGKDGAMFGFGKKTIPTGEFGLWVLKYADEFVSADAFRSLVSCLPDGYDASRGWAPVFESKGISIPTVKLYLRQYTHCVLQSVFREHSQSQRRAMVHGAISGLQETPPGYDFENTFGNLETVFEGNYEFDPRVKPLNDDGRLNYLTVPNAHILVAKYLIDRFVLHNMKNSKAFIDSFGLYSRTVASSLASAHRAMNSITSKVKISPDSASLPEVRGQVLPSRSQAQAPKADPPPSGPRWIPAAKVQPKAEPPVPQPQSKPYSGKVSVDWSEWMIVGNDLVRQYDFQNLPFAEKLMLQIRITVKMGSFGIAYSHPHLIMQPPISREREIKRTVLCDPEDGTTKVGPMEVTIAHVSGDASMFWFFEENSKKFLTVLYAMKRMRFILIGPDGEEIQFALPLHNDPTYRTEFRRIQDQVTAAY
jgi:hypothetical protein